MKNSNSGKTIFSLLVMLVFTGVAFGQEASRPMPGTKKAAVVAQMKGRKLEFVKEKSSMTRYVQSVIDEADKGTIVKDLYLRTIRKNSYLGLRLGRGDEITGTLFLDLVPASTGATGKYILGPGATYCTSGACKSCEPNGKGGCLCATDPLVGMYAECYLRPVVTSLVSIRDILTARFLAEGFEPVDEPSPKNDVKAIRRSTTRND